MAQKNIMILVNGRWRRSASGKTMQKYSPVSGKPIETIQAANKDDVSEAIGAAEKSWESWYALGSKKRGAILKRSADLISARRKELEDIIIWENGKVAKEAKEEVDGVIDQIDYYSGFERKLTGSIVEGESYNRKIFQYKVPYGVVVAITPWNFPAAMVARKLAPALLAGNSVVLKPSSDTPGSAEWLVRRFCEAGVPDGVLNMLTGSGSEIGDMIVSDSRVGLVTMTGSTSTGQRIMRNCSNNMAKLMLELGGKAPFIVWEDANLKNALRTLLWAKYWNAGQSCIAAERLYVHESVYDGFMKAFVAATRRLTVGNPRTSMVGPLINSNALESMERFAGGAASDGGRILTGGKRPSLKGSLAGGYFFNPTVVEGLGQKSLLMQEEIFGPMISALRISSEKEMYRLANDSKYGLASYLFTSNSDIMHRASERIRFGELYINMPGPEASQGYHTGFRMSGLAGEGSKYGIGEYMKLKNVYADYSGKELHIETVPERLIRD